MVRFHILLIILFLVYAVTLAFGQNTILVVYHSETGTTERLAQAVAEGATTDGVNVLLKSVSEVTEYDLLNSSAIIVGSPVYNANVSPQISAFIASWPFEGQPLKNKIGAAFVTAGGISAGEEIVQMNILQSMLIFGMIVVGGPDWTQPFGASAVTGEAPFNSDSPNQIDEQFLEKGRALGKRVSDLVINFISTEK